MKQQNYTLNAGSHTLHVDLDADGDCRFMVRMSVPGQLEKMRIGYLTGGYSHWVAECNRDGFSGPFKTAKAACTDLAARAWKHLGENPVSAPAKHCP